MKRQTRKPTHPVGVSVLVVDQNGQLLLGKRKNNKAAGLYSTPGGRVEKYESVLEAAYRELREETKVKASHYPPMEVIGWREHFRFGMHYFMFYVLVMSWTGEIRNGIPDKNEGWKFYPMMNLPTNHTEPPGIIAEANRRWDNYWGNK